MKLRYFFNEAKWLSLTQALPTQTEQTRNFSTDYLLCRLLKWWTQQIQKVATGNPQNLCLTYRLSFPTIRREES
jgi:hypothetical protein